MNQPDRKAVSDSIVIEAADPRLRIMISSTTVDLPEHRAEATDAINRLGHTAVVMEHGSAEWNSDAIKFSLDKVHQAQVYVGIFALRYGYIPDDPKRNPQRLSITEMEYRRAKELGIPTLIFLAGEKHPFTFKQIDFEEEKRLKLERLKAELQKTEICGFFDSPTELREEVLISVQRLQVQLIQPTLIVTAPRSLPQAPEVYAVPQYILTNQFIGRSSELAGLDAWARSADAIMVVEGIGGLGKSAVTWEWMHNRAPAAIPHLAGRVWWSFYEKGTSLVTFVRHALAYVTGQDPEALGKDSSHYQRGQQLLTELRRRPFLLVLDGFERVLTAYHRLDKAQIPDDRVDEALRECVNPPDGELLTQLLRCGPSKILISTRLFPSGLEDRGSRRPIAGVVHHKLNGLSPPDALALMRHTGVTGDEKAMLAFADQFGRHSLLLKIVCGMIADYRRKPHDFDAWRADPIYGGGLKLSEVELKQRYTHILHFALAGLNELTRKLLCRIAVISENATYDTLAVLNPFLPPKPEEVKEPSDPSKGWRWRGMSEEEKQKAQQSYREAREAYRGYQEKVRAYYAGAEYRRAVMAFDASLKELENRGLLQWDREANRYEMHPVVRGYAAELIEAGDRTETFHKVRDHFESLPPDDLGSATELAHVAHSLEIYRCFVGAGMLDEAATFYRGDLSRTLLFSVGAYPVILELLKPLFRNDLQGMPCLASASAQSYILNVLALAYENTGQAEKALLAYEKTLKLDIEEENWLNLATGLRNLSLSFRMLARRAEGVAALSLARELAEVAEDGDGLTKAIQFQVCDAIEQGRFAEAEALDAEFRLRSQPHITFYRPGEVECWRCLSKFFQGKLTEAEWQAGYDLAVQHRNVLVQYQFLALRAEWDLGEDRPEQALEAIDQALQITNKLGTPCRDYHDLRAWALARLDRPADARAELQEGEHRLFAAEAYRALGDYDQARVCALNAYRWAWGEGPPYIRWYELERSRAPLAATRRAGAAIAAVRPDQGPAHPI